MITASRHAIALALGLAGCPHSARVNASLRPVCAPNDAPAVALSVPAAGGEVPLFRLYLFRPLAQVAGSRVRVTHPDAADGAAAEWCEASGCSVIRAGATAVAFGALRRDSSLSVEVHTARPDGTPFNWSGVARWRGATLVCG